MDDLEAMEAKIAGNAGETPPQEVVMNAENIPSARASALDIALLKKTSEEQVQILRAAVARGLDEDDPVIDIYNAATSAARSAHSTAAAALAVSDTLMQGLDRLPAQMLDGAKLAGGDVAGEIKTAAKDVAGAILQAGNLAAGGMAKDLIHVKKVINDAAVIGADKIKGAADGLVGKLDEAVDKKVDEGVATFASEAAKAAGKAAKAAGASRFAWSAAGVSFLVIFFAVVGGFIDHEYLSLTHRIAPAPFVLTASGKINCGKDAALGTGEICEIR